MVRGPGEDGDVGDRAVGLADDLRRERLAAARREYVVDAVCGALPFHRGCGAPGVKV